MDIAALAMSMKLADLKQNVSLIMTIKTMEFQQGNAEHLLEVINTSHPIVGKKR